jgi:hypothetical protein
LNLKLEKASKRGQKCGSISHLLTSPLEKKFCIWGASGCPDFLCLCVPVQFCKKPFCAWSCAKNFTIFEFISNCHSDDCVFCLHFWLWSWLWKHTELEYQMFMCAKRSSSQTWREFVTWFVVFGRPWCSLTVLQVVSYPTVFNNALLYPCCDQFGCGDE